LLPDDKPPATAPADGVATPAPRSPVDRRHVFLLVAPIIPMLIGTQLSNAFFPVLSTGNPTLLIFLAAPNRNLIVAARSAQDWLAMGDVKPLLLFAVIGFLRLIAPDWFFFEIGSHYGETAISWMERRTPTFGQLLRELERLFAKAGWLLVLIMPNNYVCLLAGGAGMRRSLFWALNIVGTIGRLLVMWWIGQTFQEYIDRVLGFISEHRIPLLALTVGLVLLSTLTEWRSGNSKVQALMDLEHELEEQSPEVVGDAGDDRPEDRAS
jgi:membrane protein DedA with SNARE-associated domain